jgi:hypothetical protein
MIADDYFFEFLEVLLTRWKIIDAQCCAHGQGLRKEAIPDLPYEFPGQHCY